MAPPCVSTPTPAGAGSGGAPVLCCHGECSLSPSPFQSRIQTPGCGGFCAFTSASVYGVLLSLLPLPPLSLPLSDFPRAGERLEMVPSQQALLLLSYHSHPTGTLPAPETLSGICQYPGPSTALPSHSGEFTPARRLPTFPSSSLGNLFHLHPLPPPFFCPLHSQISLCLKLLTHSAYCLDHIIEKYFLYNFIYLFLNLFIYLKRERERKCACR